MTKTKRKPTHKEQELELEPYPAKYPRGITLRIIAERKGGLSDFWPYDDTPDIRHAVYRALERRGCGVADQEFMHVIGDGSWELIFDFYIKDESEARKFIAAVMKEVAHGWKYRVSTKAIRVNFGPRKEGAA